MRDNDDCSFCGEETEDLCHLFSTCPVVRELWKSVELYLLKRFNGIKLEMTTKNIILNTIVSGKHVANFICLVTKQFIYKQRCVMDALNFPILRAAICKLENIEKYIAIKKGNVVVHNRKWRVDENDTGVSLSQYVRNYFEHIE